MFNHRHKTKIFILAGVAITAGIVIAIAAYLSANNINQEAVEKMSDGVSATEENAPTPSATVTKPSPSTTAAKEAYTYTQAIVKYQDRRIEFDTNCQAKPVISTFKNGTEIMIDNRSAAKKNFAVDGKNYTIEGFDFKIITLTAKTFPKTIQIDCGNSKNNSNIYLQK